jgi:hypothetical protein
MQSSALADLNMLVDSAATEDPKAKANGAAKGSPAAPKEELAKPAAAEAKPQKENLAAQQAELMRDYPGLQDYEKPVFLSAHPFSLQKIGQQTCPPCDHICSVLKAAFITWHVRVELSAFWSHLPSGVKIWSFDTSPHTQSKRKVLWQPPLPST